MKPWLLIAAIQVAVLLVFGGAYLLFRRWRRTNPKWQRPIPGYFYPYTAYRAPVGFPPLRLTKALQMAETCLIKFGQTWTAGQLGAVCFRAHVVVTDNEIEADLSGLKVRGTKIGHVIQVGFSLNSLCHELAHLCEAVLEQELDESHSMWDRDGVWNAIRAYEEWLIKQNWETP